MQILTGKALPRRTFLQGISAAIALPYLDAMEPAFRGLRKSGGAAASGRTRLVCIESVHGAAGSNTQIGIHNQAIVSTAVAPVAPSLITAVESAAILIAVTGNATTAASDIVFNFLEVNAMN